LHLIQAFYFVLGLGFALRPEELVRLTWGQLQIVNKQGKDTLELNPGKDKNHQGGLGDNYNPVRTLVAIEAPYCPVKLYTILFEHRSCRMKDGKLQNRVFCKPLVPSKETPKKKKTPKKKETPKKKKTPKKPTNEELPTDPRLLELPTDSWYGIVIGKNPLSKWVKEIAERSGIKPPNDDQKWTAHCLRVTAITILANEDVPDFRIMDRTGHASLTVVQKYKRMNIKNLEEDTQLLLSSQKPKKKQKTEDTAPSNSQNVEISAGILSKILPFVNKGTISNMNIIINMNK